MSFATKLSGAALATAAAAMFLTAPIASADAGDNAPGAIGKCMGANGCRGLSACKTDNNACKGQNKCKGQGFTEISRDECNKVGGKFTPLSK